MTHASDIALYSDPPAYDILHTPGTAEEVTDLQCIADRYVTARGKPLWLEPACGTGRYLRVAAARGTRCLGFDLDQGMVGYANTSFQRRNLPARAFAADMTDFADQLGRDRPTFAFNTINTFRHLHTDQQALDHIEQTARALRPGGVYLVGISLALYNAEFPSEDVWEAARGPCHVHQLVQYLPADEHERLERVYSVLTITTPTTERHEPSSYALRSYSPEQWQALLERSAMKLVASTDELGNPREPEAPGYNLFVLSPRA